MIALGRRQHEVRLQRDDLLEIRLHPADLRQLVRRGGEIGEVVRADQPLARADGIRHLGQVRRERDDAADLARQRDVAS
jgi:hypothetical protein